MRNLKRQNQRNVERERKRAFTFHLYGGVVLGLGDKVRANLFLGGDTGIIFIMVGFEIQLKILALYLLN